MSIHFHPLTVKEVRSVTDQCVTVEFEVPDELKKDFQYNQGQSLTMRTTINGEEIRRTYSLCSSPLDNTWKVAIKKVDGGIFSSFANEQLKPGDTLEVMEPVGRFFTELNPGQKKNYLAFAAGSGITPVISIIRTTLMTEPESRFTLVYGNQRRSSIIFFEELEALKNLYMDRFRLVNLLSREKTEIPLFSGRIDEHKLDELSGLINYKMIDEFFICGPEDMIFCIKDYLQSYGADEKHIHIELFTSSGQGKKPVSNKQRQGIAPPRSTVTIRLDGRSFDIDLTASDDLTILEAALQQGAELPFACKGGMCCTCKARLLEGEVDMDVHWGLEQDEIEKGFILTCQSHPKTKKVVIDFDIK